MKECRSLNSSKLSFHMCVYTSLGHSYENVFNLSSLWIDFHANYLIEEFCVRIHFETFSFCLPKHILEKSTQCQDDEFSMYLIESLTCLGLAGSKYS